jgi:uncharacterized protein YggE
MKRLTFILGFLLCALIGFSQGAGNFMFSQQKNNRANESLYYDNAVFDGQFYSGASSAETTYSHFSDTLVYINAHVLKNVHADSYMIMLGLSQVGESLEVCHQLLGGRIDGFVNELINLGIAKQDIYTDFISQAPIFSIEVEKKLFSKKYVEIPKGFELKKNLHISYNSVEQADQIIELAAKYEIYDIIKVDYVVNDVASVYEDLRDECVTIINNKIEDYSALNISTEGMYRSIEESHSCSYPIERYEKFVSYTPETYKALSQSAILSNGNSGIDIYYNRIPYNRYDKVINPDATEPVVQFSYFCRLEIVLKKK